MIESKRTRAAGLSSGFATRQALTNAVGLIKTAHSPAPPNPPQPNPPDPAPTPSASKR